jgi:ATP-binding cassette, subfamily B, heavy metal transporter
MSDPHRRIEIPHNNRRDWQSIQNILPYLWEYRGRVLIALSSLVLAKAATVGIPLILKEIVDALAKAPNAQLILPISFLIGYGFLRLSSGLFNELRDAIFAKVRYRAMRRLSNKVMTHLHNLSLRFHLERKTGAISRDLTRGTQSVSSLMNYMVFNIIPTIAEFLLIAFILLYQYDIKFTIVTFVTVMIYVAFTFAITNWRMHYRHDMNALESEANNQAVDSLINYETVKYFNNEPFEINRYDQTMSKWEEAATNSQVSMSALNFGQGTIIAIGVTILMFMAAQGVVEKTMSIGDLVLVNAFLLQLFIPLNFLGVVYRSIKYALADMDLLFKLLEEKPEIVDAKNAKTLEINNAAVSFKNVSFHYQPERPILKNISFEIPNGKKIAVVGSSGAGKSTLARLLYRFYDVTNGSIEINNQEIRDLTQQSLRAAIGIVPQDTVLFNESIYYNIAYANPNAPTESVEQAAKLAHLHEFIISLPNGYETVVGERGLKLSGGEKQRVAIARAIFKNPKILIFDEATSSLDSRTEQHIQQALQELATNHTTLVIAHRLSTIVDADEILVMESGEIVERGTHNNLLQQDGIYARMWALQQQEQVTDI